MDLNEKIELLKAFAAERPEADFIAGYGSANIAQEGYNQKMKITHDVIMGVPKSKLWHLENMNTNFNDYSFIGRIFFYYGEERQYNWGAPVTYITGIKHPPKTNNRFKAGIIDTSAIIHGNLNWGSGLYIAGRLQKPFILVKSTPEIDESIDINRRNALLVALTLLDKKDYNIRDLYITLCKISYMGGRRFENKNKVTNIVDANIEDLNTIYRPFNLFDTTGTTTKIDVDLDQVLANLYNVPLHLSPFYEMIDTGNFNKEELESLKDHIKTSITNINKYTARRQTVKGIFTAGVCRAVPYGLRKTGKLVKSIFKPVKKTITN